MPARVAKKPQRIPRMLIVDDEESITRTMQMMFEERGFTVQTACSCAEALRALGNGHKYDAVITDLDMHVDYLVTKPVDLDQLFSAVDRLLARRRDDPASMMRASKSALPRREI